MKEEACSELRRRICPFISCGDQMVYCRGANCNACRPVPVEEGTVWVCTLIEPEFASGLEDMHGSQF